MVDSTIFSISRVYRCSGGKEHEFYCADLLCLRSQFDNLTNKFDSQALFERLSLIQTRIEKTDEQLTKLLDLYLSGDFAKELLVERKSRMVEALAKLRTEKRDVENHIQAVPITEEQLTEIEAFCAVVRSNLDNATFENKRQLFELLDVRGKLVSSMMKG